jgi:hypothetical protein
MTSQTTADTRYGVHSEIGKLRRRADHHGVGRRLAGASAGCPYLHRAGLCGLSSVVLHGDCADRYRTEGRLELRPRPASTAVTGWLVTAYAVTVYGMVLPAAVLYTDWYLALSYWVAFNTLIFAAITVFQLLPPVRRRSAVART